MASLEAQLAKGVFQHKYATGAHHPFWISKRKPEIIKEKRNSQGEQEISDHPYVPGVSSEPNSVEECISLAAADESESPGTINIPISSGTVDQMPLDLRLEISCLSSSFQETFTSSINSDLGVDPTMDNYSFSATKKLDHITLVGREMPTADEWLEARVVNFMDNNELSLDHEEPPVCPNLALLFLQRNKGLTRIPALFFSQMPSLSFLDLSHTRIRELPQSLFTLKNLKVLLLRSCLCLDSFPPDIEHLINMEVLDLLGTDLYHMIPEEIGKLEKLRQLHLSFYGPEYGSGGYADISPELIPAGAISKLQALQALSIVVHPEDQRWKMTVTNIIQNVAELNKLNYLQFYFPTVDSLESFIQESLSWKELRLKRFNFIVGHNIKRIISRLPEEVESKYDQHERCLRFVNGDNQAPEVMKTLLKDVTAFYLDHHLKIRSLSEFGIISNFNELRFCVVRECPNMQTIGDEKSETAAFQNLEYLGLHYLWKLERIWEGPVPRESFKEVKYLMVGTCPKLKHIASRSTLESLSKLETLIIEDCENLESIVEENEMAKYVYDDTPLLPQLTKLVLRHLPQLVTLGSGLFPSEKINISKHYCPKLIIRPRPSRPRPSRRKVLVHHITAATSALREKLEKKFLQLHLHELA